jgi:DNA-binding IscR family transcriptional regulator
MDFTIGDVSKHMEALDLYFSMEGDQALPNSNGKKTDPCSTRRRWRRALDK